MMNINYRHFDLLLDHLRCKI